MAEFVQRDPASLTAVQRPGSALARGAAADPLLMEVVQLNPFAINRSPISRNAINTALRNSS